MDTNGIRSKSVLMLDKVYEMIVLIEKGFMENKSEFLSKAMKKEDEINETEKGLTKDVLELSGPQGDGKDKKELSSLQQAIEMFERMGDEAASLVERIEIKVAEHLLFSDIGVEQFNQTYSAMKKSVEMLMEFLKTGRTDLKERIIVNGFHVKELVERYRKEHADRLVQGICTPMGASMYFDMLDFTGNLARHASNVAKLF